MDTETILYEPDEDGIVSCINIDIFVYDNAPDSISECKKCMTVAIGIPC